MISQFIVFNVKKSRLKTEKRHYQSTQLLCALSYNFIARIIIVRGSQRVLILTRSRFLSLVHLARNSRTTFDCRQCGCLRNRLIRRSWAERARQRCRQNTVSGFLFMCWRGIGHFFTSRSGCAYRFILKRRVMRSTRRAP